MLHIFSFISHKWLCLYLLSLSIRPPPVNAINAAKISHFNTTSIIDSCGKSFIKVYTDCKRLRLKLADKISMIDSSSAIPEFLTLLPDDILSTVHVTMIEYSSIFPVETIGQLIDAFLQPRPQWSVYHEEYSWQKHRTNHVILIRATGSVDTALTQMASHLNPTDCRGKYTVLRGYGDFNEWGNEHWNIASYYNSLRGTITLIHMTRATFIEDDYCPNEINKYNCAFLPLTNCPLPSHYTNCSQENEKCTPGGFVYNGADTNAKLLFRDYNREEFYSIVSRATIEEVSPSGDRYLSASVFDFNNIGTEKYNMDGIGSLFFVAVFLRKNFDFRSRAAKLIHGLRHAKKPFSPNDECVAIHIRHHDRVKPGYDMLKYCNEFVLDADGICRNSTTGLPFFADGYKDCPVSYYDYGCGSVAPFGAISFESYLKAAEVVMEKPAAGLNASRTVFIMTDDGDWVRRESERFRHEWSIHVLPAPPNHRGRAAINGATLFASFELAQQCTGLVGHSVSAISVLLQALMCYKNGAKNSYKFASCPRFYDFRWLVVHT